MRESNSAVPMPKMSGRKFDFYRERVLMIGGSEGLNILNEFLHDKIEAFLYPTGAPYPYSLETLIEELKQKKTSFHPFDIRKKNFLFALETGQYEATALLADYSRWTKDNKKTKIENKELALKTNNEILATIMVHPCGQYRQEIAKKLLKRGATFTTSWQKCILEGQAVETILRCNDQTELDSHQIGLLSYLAANNRLDVLCSLLPNSPHDTPNKLTTFIENQKKGALEDAILAAVGNGHMEMYELLMTQRQERQDGSPAVKNNNGETPALVAAKSNQVAMFTHLLSKGQTILDEIDKEGNNAAHLAAKNGHVEMLTFLFSQEISLFNQENTEKKTPVDLAFKLAPLCAIECLKSLKISPENSIKLAIKNNSSHKLRYLLKENGQSIGTNIIEYLCGGFVTTFPAMLSVMEEYQRDNYPQQLGDFWHTVIFNSILGWKLPLIFLHFSQSLFRSTKNPLNILQEHDTLYYYMIACILCPEKGMVDPETLEKELDSIKKIFQPKNEPTLWDYAIMAPHHDPHKDWFDFLSPLKEINSMVLDLTLKQLFGENPVPTFSFEQKIELLRCLHKEYLQIFPEGIFSMAALMRKTKEEPLLLVSDELKTFLQKIGKEPPSPISDELKNQVPPSATPPSQNVRTPRL